MKSRKLACMVIAAAVAGVMAIMPVSAKTVVGNMLPEEEWSSESTMTPVKGSGWLEAEIVAHRTAATR